MKIIIRVDTDDQGKIEHLNKQIANKQEFIISMGEHIRIYVISDFGGVTEIK